LRERRTKGDRQLPVVGIDDGKRLRAIRVQVDGVAPNVEEPRLRVVPRRREHRVAEKEQACRHSRASISTRTPRDYARSDAGSRSRDMTRATRSRSASWDSSVALHLDATAAIMQSTIPRGVIPAARQRR